MSDSGARVAWLTTDDVRRWYGFDPSRLSDPDGIKSKLVQTFNNGEIAMIRVWLQDAVREYACTKNR